MKKIKNILYKLCYSIKKYGIISTCRRILFRIFNTGKYKNENNYLLYQEWIKNNEPTEKELLEQTKVKFEKNPKISVIVPMYNTREDFYKVFSFNLSNMT